MKCCRKEREARSADVVFATLVMLLCTVYLGCRAAGWQPFFSGSGSWADLSVRSVLAGFTGLASLLAMMRSISWWVTGHGCAGPAWFVSMSLAACSLLLQVLNA